ncbi:MAG: DUF952 domain-containing protein [Hyphomicrobium sp.]|jgi:uncharacterized protein (DUF952 family)|nr:DUF952 domain-containing protein [Hyphomicrobium sp.]
MTDIRSAETRADVFKVMPSAHWANARTAGFFTGSADDVRDGFIHLSNADQLSGTLAKYFRDQPDLLLIGFSSADLGGALKWEASRGGALFPHYYGALPVTLALWQRPLRLGPDGIPHVDDKDKL